MGISVVSSARKAVAKPILREVNLLSAPFISIKLKFYLSFECITSALSHSSSENRNMQYGTFVKQLKRIAGSEKDATVDNADPNLKDAVVAVPSKYQKDNVELEDALDIAGLGRYQIQHCALMTFILAASLIQLTDSSFVLPAATCDLSVQDSIKGIIISLPNIGIVLTAPLWGRAADTWGRKPVLLISATVAGFFGGLAAFMPNLLGYAACKLILGLFLSPPSSLAFAYFGELLIKRKRDLGMLLLSSFLNMSTVLTPLLAWAILPLPVMFDLGFINFRSWRLLTLIDALPLLIGAAILSKALESPKYLVTRGRYDEALNNLKYVYMRNHKNCDLYPVDSLKRKEPMTEKLQNKGSVLSLLRPPHVKWMALTGFLMLSVYSLMNGLFLFAPDTINKLMTKTDFNGTICDILNPQDNAYTKAIGEPVCIDQIKIETFKIMALTTWTYSLLILTVSIAPIPKKYILVITFSASALTSLVSAVSKFRVLSAIAMSGLQISALGKGPLTAYCVELFPTTLRGTAVSILMMFGRIGSILGSNIASTCLTSVCDATFYTWTALMLACGFLSLVLPGQDKQARPS